MVLFNEVLLEVNKVLNLVYYFGSINSEKPQMKLYFRTFAPLRIGCEVHVSWFL